MNNKRRRSHEQQQNDTIDTSSTSIAPSASTSATGTQHRNNVTPAVSPDNQNYIHNNSSVYSPTRNANNSIKPKSTTQAAQITNWFKKQSANSATANAIVSNQSNVLSSKAVAANRMYINTNQNSNTSTKNYSTNTPASSLPHPQSQPSDINPNNNIQQYEQKINQYKSEISDYKLEISSLTNALNDKEAQLKAVSNNHTIRNTTLNSRLIQCEEEINNLKKKNEICSKTFMDTIEALVRRECVREENLKRQKLASDGVRLGRWVYTRIGMRVEPVWEDGDVVKEVKVKKMALRKKKESLEFKLKEGTGLMEASSSFEREEFEESIRFHLEELEREEVELRQEEDALRLEKASHKRELRRIANEDGSRFRNRPKVCSIVNVLKRNCSIFSTHTPTIVVLYLYM